MTCSTIYDSNTFEPGFQIETGSKNYKIFINSIKNNSNLYKFLTEWNKDRKLSPSELLLSELGEFLLY